MDFVKRPVAVFTLSFFAMFCIALNSGLFCSPMWEAVNALLFVFSFAGVLMTRKKIRIFLSYVAIVSFALFLSVLFALTFVNSAKAYDSLCSDEHEVVMTITREITKSNGYNCFIAHVTEIDGKEASFRVALSSEKSFEVGDKLKGGFNFQKPKSDDSFDEKKYYLSLGATLKGELTNYRIIGKDTSLIIKIKKLNEKLSEILSCGLDGDALAVADALVLGNRGGITNEIKHDFSRLGISHLLAISGMHISFIGAGFSFVMKKIRVSKKYILLLTIALMSFYMVLTGLSPSVVRAALLSIMMSVIYIIGISYDGLTCLGICACVMVLFDPYCAYSAGMQLSFCSYLGCLTASGIVRRYVDEESLGKRSFKKYALKIFNSLVFTFVVVIFTLPISLLYFDSLSIVSPLTNLFFIPAFSIVLYLSIALIALYPIPDLFHAFSFIVEKFISFLLSASSAISDIKGITVSMKYKFAPYIAVLLIICIVSLVFIKKKKYVLIPCICIFLLVWSYAVGIKVYNGSMKDKCELTRCSNGSGESIVLLSEGKSCVIDVSSNGISQIRSAIYGAGERYITEIDAFVITRYRTRTFSTLKYFLESTDVKTVYLPLPSLDENEIHLEINDYLDQKNIKVMNYSYGSEFDFSGCVVKIVPFKENSAGTVCLSVIKENESLLYLGKGWSKYKNGVMKNFDPASFDNIFFGSYGEKITSSYSFGNSEAKIYSFVEETPDNKRYIYFLKDSEKYDKSSTVSVVIG